LVHRRRRKHPGKSADERASDEESRRPGGTIGRGERGEGRGKRGLLIGVEIDGHYSRGISGAFTPASFRFQREKRGNGGGDGADRWVPPVGEGRERAGYRFGSELGGLRAASGAGPDRFPRGPFLFLFFFPLFPFLFSLFLHTLFKFDPN
jgi:hypothetical protein